MAGFARQLRGERAARMAFSMIAEPDDPITGRALARLGGVEALRLVESDEPVPGVARTDALVWRGRLAGRMSANVLDRISDAQRRGFVAIIPTDSEWPAGLDDLGDRAPYVLWTRGATSFLATPLRTRVTITGSRAATHYGERITADLAANLAEDDRIIVAGGAFGIEGAAHRAVPAEGGQTIAVLAGDVDRAYPAAHRELLEHIGDVGLLVSELPPGATPSRQRFVARSRLLAALSGVTVIPEAGIRSGAMRTAALAHALGRGIGAVPGPVTSVASEGPHELIKRRIASMVTTTSDVTVLHDSGADIGRSLGGPEPGAEFARRQPLPPQESGRSL